MSTLRTIPGHAAALFLAAGLGLWQVGPVRAQDYSFTSGAIPLCDTSEFTSTVSGLDPLVDPTWGMTGVYLDHLWIDITSDHPQTLQINLTSPQGTTLVLSAFNGAGGQNYTDTWFGFYNTNSIAGAAAPFTGSWMPQGGGFSLFTGEDPNGTWTITVIDTSCVNGGEGPGGTWTPGWFNGGSGSGAFGFGYSSPPPPCMFDLGSATAYVCDGSVADLTSYLDVSVWGGPPLIFYDPTNNSVPDPTQVSVAGFYYAEVMDWNTGCYYFGTVMVIDESPLEIPDMNVVLCDPDQPVDLYALYGIPWSYLSCSSGGIPLTLQEMQAVSVPGVYQVVGTNSGGCVSSGQVTVLEGGFDLGPDQVVGTCAGGTTDLTLLYNTAGLSDMWYFAGQPVATPQAVSAPGVYTLEVSDGSGCQSSAEVIVEQLQAIDLGPDAIVDLCSNGYADLTTYFDTDGAVAQWTLDGAPVGWPWAVNGPGNYRLVVDAGGCSDTAMVQVSVLQAPDLGADEAVIACVGSSIDVEALYMTQGLSALWTLNGAPVLDPTAVEESGTYRLVVVALNACRDTAMVSVDLLPTPVLGQDVDLSICAGSAADLSMLVVGSDGTAVWSLNDVVIAAPTQVVDAGTYRLVRTNGYGCSDTLLAHVQVLPAPDLGPDGVLMSCAGTAVDLASGLTGWSTAVMWTHNEVEMSDPDAVVTSGDYRAVLVLPNGCADTAWVSLTMVPTPDPGPDLAFTLCPWQTVDLGALVPVSGSDITYTLNGVAVPDPTAVGQAGTYTVTVTNADGCSGAMEVTITNVDCLCEADFVAEAECIQEPVRFALMADSAVHAVRWSFEGAAAASTEHDPQVRFHRAGEVKVILEVTLSCGMVRVERAIEIADCTDRCAVWVPSSFTPNGDGVNESWGGTTECEAEEYLLQVFDRWGEQVFSAQDPRVTWDGTVKGKPLSAGVYAYRLHYRLPYQQDKQVAGSVTIVR